MIHNKKAKRRKNEGNCVCKWKWNFLRLESNSMRNFYCRDCEKRKDGILFLNIPLSFLFLPPRTSLLWVWRPGMLCKSVVISTVLMEDVRIPWALHWRNSATAMYGAYERIFIIPWIMMMTTKRMCCSTCVRKRACEQRNELGQECHVKAVDG